MKKITFICAMLLAAHARTQTVNITADKDNTMYSENVTFSNGSGQNFFAGRTKDGYIRRALLHFDLSSIPSNAVVTAVTITLNNNRQASNSAGIALHKLNADWGEGASDAAANEGSGTAGQTGDATWTRRMLPSTNWTTAGGEFVTTASATVANVNAGTVAVSGGTLVADVQSFVSNSASNFGWIIRGTSEATSQTTLRFASRNTGTTTQRPVLSVTYNTALPVNLQSFTAYLHKQDAVLTWQTASEVNNSHFILEHSKNSIDFIALTRLNANAVSHRYTYTHRNVQGINYYRLVQYDVNGVAKYSNVVLVTANTGKTLQVYPNPVLNNLSLVSSFDLAGTTYLITSLGGRVVQQGTLTTNLVNVRQLPAGQFWVLLSTLKGGVLKASFMKH